MSLSKILIGGNEKDQRGFGTYHAWKSGDFILVGIKSIVAGFFTEHPAFKSRDIKTVVVDGFAKTEVELERVRTYVEAEAVTVFGRTIPNFNFIFLAGSNVMENLSGPFEVINIEEERFK